MGQVLQFIRSRLGRTAGFTPAAALPEEQLIDGISLRMGRRSYVVAPLNFRSLRRLLPTIAKLRANSTPGPTEFDAMIDVVRTALSRNYPTITRQEVEEGMDMRNFRQVLAATLGSSGLVPVDPEQPAPAGTATLTGAESTASLSPSPGGLGNT